ncbi:cytidine deaminase [Sphingomonas immobilis]|uniref:Cytidine deaminase n=1 Tax=Sphingomonas immobilis TaxID=3063997 RepID=A0ABT9A0G2_9SPHN|nr:cytidine deaminase [Sphingomonas sp. CA1-15]MDO7842942.1 cytidine deaminase [Sphingomonas sp. CA1-15]
MTDLVLEEATGARLIAAAREAALKAHAPYSRFGVGAAVLLADGSVVTGANFENASYGLSLCAETVALATASSAGRLRDVVAIGVIGGAMDAAGTPRGDAVVGPCGRCRQVINEAAQMGGRDVTVWCAAAEGDAVERYRLSELLPHAFGPGDLGITG